MTSILVVEDQPLLLMNISEELSDRGFTVLEAGNADEALRRLADNPLIRLIFTDVDMPGSMNGLGLADVVRGEYPDVGIIVTSGHKTLDATVLPTGGRFYAKPYRTDMLAATMREMISRQASA